MTGRYPLSMAIAAGRAASGNLSRAASAEEVVSYPPAKPVPGQLSLFGKEAPGREGRSKAPAIPKRK
jgi:hypothetical protein